MSSAEHERWVERARAVRIETEVGRRGIKLNGNGHERAGPCPKCGGDDRFSINTTKGVWHCRGCDRGGDVTELVEHLDGTDFLHACERLTGEPPPRANGRARSAAAREVKVAEYLYHEETGNVVSAQERVEYQNPDGTFVLKDGKRKKKFIQKRPDPDRPGKWIKKITDDNGNPVVPIVPYRL